MIFYLRFFKLKSYLLIFLFKFKIFIIKFQILSIINNLSLCISIHPIKARIKHKEP